jgi:hypothetical protein
MYRSDSDYSIFHVPIKQKLLLLIAALLLAAVTGGIFLQALSGPAQAQSATWLRAEGNRIVHESGQTVVLR